MFECERKKTLRRFASSTRKLTNLYSFQKIKMSIFISMASNRLENGPYLGVANLSPNIPFKNHLNDKNLRILLKAPRGI